MKNICLFLFALVVLTLTGCNNDIFLDSADMPEHQRVTIEGDGGVAAFDIPTKGLERIELDVMSSSMKYCHYYNASGAEIDYKSPASEVSMIVFENFFTKLELKRDGKRLTIRSISYANDYEGIWTVRFEYNYGVRWIDVEVLPGKPVRLADVRYNDDMVTNERAMIRTFRTSFHNNGPLPQRYEVLPYLNEIPFILVEPANHEFSLSGNQFVMPVPMYVNGQWVVQQKDDVKLGTKVYYPGPDRMTKVTIDVPANSNVDIFTDVSYVGAKITGQMVFCNDVLDLTLSEDIRVTSYYPTGYEIRIEDAK